MSYAAIAKALYDYEAQDPENELSFKEDDVLYIIEKEDEEWWKAKSKDTDAAEGQIGLIPANYVEELPPTKRGQALYAYTSTSPEELSMAEDDQLDIFDTDDEWHLVRLASDPSSPLGFVPVNYTQIVDEHGTIDVIEEVPGQPLPAPGTGSYKDPEEMVREQKKRVESRKADGIETWTISELDKKKKKKKGTLGVGNAAVFFASENDKGPVKQYPITSLTSVSQPSSKLLLLTLSDAPEPLSFHCGSKDVAEAIIRKLEYSKEAAGEELDREHAEAVHTSEEDEPAAAPEPKNVRWAPSPGPESPQVAEPASPAGGASTQAATALYDFVAQGEDELTVNEGESLTVVDVENDEWWLVRNARGEEGVVPAQYVEIGEGGPRDVEEDEDDGGAAEAAEAERAAAEAAAIERAAREKEEREAADHAFALKLEQEERAKRERRERRRQDEERKRKEEEANERRRAREAARLAPPPEPPKISKRPSAHDVAAAARSLPPTKGRSQPDRPSGSDTGGRPKPSADRVRTWNDKTGQFKVEAEFLGLNGNKIRLHKLNGVIIEVPVEKMSPEDVHFVRKVSRKSSRIDEDDVPLAAVAARSPAPRSEESRARQELATPSRPSQAKKPRFDWFEFFLSAGCDMDDCTRYATNFERDRMDDSILPDIDASTMRSLGLREGDVIRVKKAISARFAKKTPEQQAQILQDEEYARKLQEHENNPNGGPPPAPPTSLFTGPGGKLANNTRRGRPERRGTVSETVDASTLAAATDKLAQTKISEPARDPTPPLLAQSPPPAELKPAVTGFDDDAWTLRPSSAKPTTPNPVGSAAPSSSSAGVSPSLLNQINSIQRPASSVTMQNTGSSFDFLSQIPGNQRAPSAPIQQTQTGGSTGAPASYHAGLGMGNSSSSMSQLLTAQQTGAFNPSGPRGPVAPIPQNQGLLNPLIPTQTGLGQFVPTRNSLSPSATGQGMGMQPQQTGFVPQQQMQQQPMQQMQQPMYAQQTGFPGQQGFQGMQPNFTGYPQQQQQPQQQSVFNTFASVPSPQPPQQQQGPAHKFQPANIFANMKTGNFAKPEEQAPQPSQKYDALRGPGAGGLQPLMTGYNGGMMQSQPTGFGMGMQPQQTGFMGQQQPGMFQQQPTGYPGQQYPRFQ